MPECNECKYEGKECPNSKYSKNDIYNNHKRCSVNTEFSKTSDKFEPKIMKEKVWIVGVGGDEICIEQEVSWSRETEEKLRKIKHL